MGNGAQRIPSWPGATAPTKAAYICADQPVTFTFRLRHCGGPYIPVADIHVSHCQAKSTSSLGALRRARVASIGSPSLRTSASRLVVPASLQDRTSICCLRVLE